MPFCVVDTAKIVVKLLLRDSLQLKHVYPAFICFLLYVCVFIYLSVCLFDMPAGCQRLSAVWRFRLCPLLPVPRQQALHVGHPIQRVHEGPALSGLLSRGPGTLPVLCPIEEQWLLEKAYLTSDHGHTLNVSGTRVAKEVFIGVPH